MNSNTVNIQRILLFLAMIGILAGSAIAQDLRTTLFAKTDELMAQGRETRADILAPKNWGKGMERYTSAERKLTDGKNLDNIRKDLTEANRYFGDAIKATKLADVTLAVPLKARDDAASVDAAKSAPDLWGPAEMKFAEACRKLEEGNVNDARKKGAEAEAMYRDAELSAIKTSFFDETRKLLAKADEEKAEKYAPVTLARSRSLLTEAEAALNENRYDTDRPRSLAMEARYEALHALHLTKMVMMIEDKVMTREDLILEAEKPLVRIAGALNIQVGFDQGFVKPTEKIVAAIQTRDAEMDELASEVNDGTDRITSLTEQVVQLETTLGGAAEAQEVLQAQIEAQETARLRFTEVEHMFNRDEARILRESGNVIIRLAGVNFASGKAVIQPEHFALLTKVKEAIALYPGASIRIEGHTDAYGTDETNLVLSQERADAVAKYLLANSNLKASKMEAVGYGESNPIANNETKEGRANNRRIDIVIIPAK